MAEKRLTREIAEQFLADEDSVDLSEFTELDDDAAERLSTYPAALCLNGLTSLSDAAADRLSKHTGWFLDLSGLASLSDAAAVSLSEYCGYLHLNFSPNSLSDAAAESLEKRKGRGDLDELRKYLRKYATLCQELNDRLRHCQEYLKLHLWSAAIQLSEMEPNLPDRFALLASGELPELLDRCSMYEELETPPALLTDIYAELNAAYEYHWPLERLFAKHRRLALERSSLKSRLTVARSLAQRDVLAEFWEDDVIALERSRIDEIKEEAMVAHAAGDKNALAELLAELKSPNWFELPRIGPGETLNPPRDNRLDHPRLPELTDSLGAQWDYWGRSFQESDPVALLQNPNFLTVVKMVDDWFDHAEKIGVLDTDPLYIQVAPINEAVVALQAAAEQSSEWSDKIQRLREVLRDSSTSRKQVENAWEGVRRLGLPPEELKDVYDQRMKSLWWKGNWERVLGVGLFVALVLAGIVFAIVAKS